jgi:UDP-N-acetylmuramate dehydrogenase
MLAPTLLTRLRAAVAGSVREGVPLAPLTTFEIGGPAECLVVPAGIRDVSAVVGFCREQGLPLSVFGGGSNLLVPDEGVPGVVLCTAGGLTGMRVEKEMFVLGAGVTDRGLSELARSHRVTGYEWLYDLPGTAGGAAYMNAGNNDGEMAPLVAAVTCVGLDGTVRRFAAGELELGYRRSRFMRDPAILCELEMLIAGRGDPGAIREKMERIRQARAARFPPETRNAGSIFKRPPGHFAGKLIEEAACGGWTEGDAMVSQRHKGFIVNRGRARAADVLKLIERVREQVLTCSGIRLETEVEVLRPIFPRATLPR